MKMIICTFTCARSFITPYNRAREGEAVNLLMRITEVAVLVLTHKKKGYPQKGVGKHIQYRNVVTFFDLTTFFISFAKNKDHEHTNTETNRNPAS